MIGHLTRDRNLSGVLSNPRALVELGINREADAHDGQRANPRMRTQIAHSIVSNLASSLPEVEAIKRGKIRSPLEEFADEVGDRGEERAEDAEFFDPVVAFDRRRPRI